VLSSVRITLRLEDTVPQKHYIDSVAGGSFLCRIFGVRSMKGQLFGRWLDYSDALA